MKKPNETRFKHNFVIAAVLAIFLLATGCPNTNNNLGGKDKPSTGGTDTQKPKDPNQTPPDTSSTEGEVSGGESSSETTAAEARITVTLKDLTKKTADNYDATNVVPYCTTGKAVKSPEGSKAPTAAVYAAINKILAKLAKDGGGYTYGVFKADGTKAKSEDIVDGVVLYLGKLEKTEMKGVITLVSVTLTTLFEVSGTADKYQGFADASILRDYVTSGSFKGEELNVEMRNLLYAGLGKTNIGPSEEFVLFAEDVASGAAKPRALNINTADLSKYYGKKLYVARQEMKEVSIMVQDAEAKTGTSYKPTGLYSVAKKLTLEIPKTAPADGSNATDLPVFTSAIETALSKRIGAECKLYKAAAAATADAPTQSDNFAAGKVVFVCKNVPTP